MKKIIPSTKLKMVSVHKLMDFTCLRKGFWRRIMNLESRNINENFWYGGVLGEGFEAMLMGRNWRKAIALESIRRQRGYNISSNSEAKIELDFRLIEASLLAAKLQPEVKRMKLSQSQIRFSVPLKCGVKFCGTLDGIGTYQGKPHLFEFKTAKQISESYLKSLTFDKQVNGYAWAMRKQGKTVGACRYCIFKKNNRRLGNKSWYTFVENWKKDLRDPKRTEYVWYRLSLNKLTVDEVGFDIEQEAEDLLEKFNRAGKRLLDPHYWPKRENKCHDYSGCEFLPLCDNPKRWELFLRLYKQRTMLYKEEKGELSN